jgi:hypothetical protein
VNLSFAIPFRLAWARMQRMLFRPFRLEAWLVFGFAAFLSDFLSGRSGSSGSSFSWRGHGGEFPHHVLRGVGAFLLHPIWTGVILVGITIVFVVVIMLQWVSCRGRFIFLDNVVHERAGIVEPWKRFRRLGNSLFVWTLVFWLTCIAIVISIALPFVAGIAGLLSSESFQWAALGAVLGFVCLMIPFVLLVVYTSLLLNHFVVPIMHRHEVGVLAAWSRFFALFRAHPGAFILYGLFMLVMVCIVGGIVIAVGLGTCCVGLVVIAAPYVGQVVMLPVHVMFRAYGPHFLAQFGPELDVFATPASRVG